MNFKRYGSPFLVAGAMLLVLIIGIGGCTHALTGPEAPAATRLDLEELQREIAAYVPDPSFPDDQFILVTVQEGLLGGKERNGGIGACLVRKATGEILERSHNRQYEPYFRSDLHAEMDLLNRYEDRIKAVRSRNPNDPTFRDPRSMDGIVLYTSVEPCPMCLTRIINSGIKEVYYAATDENGGMGHRFENLPPSWKGMAGAMIVKPARCSAALRDIAAQLFRPMYSAGIASHQHYPHAKGDSL